jgi:hypothetical protein
MNFRTPQFLVTLVFGAMILSAGCIQIGIDLARGQKPQMFELFRRAPTTVHLRAYEERLETESWLANQLRPWMQHALFTVLDDPGAKTVRGRAGWFFYRPGVEYLTQRPTAGVGKDDPVAAICDYRDQLAARGIRLIVMPAPNKESIYPERLTRRADALSLAVGPTTRSVLERLQAAGVEVVDLFELYGGVKRDAAGESGLYLARDSHWSPAGVDVAARAVAERLLDLGWVRRGNTRYSTRSTPTARIGDLLRMLDVPGITTRYEPETVNTRQVIEASTGDPYRDDPMAEVLVLGDSFLRIYEQDEPGAAGFVAHLARELEQPVTSIVNDGGASTLVRQELHRRPALLTNKKVVVWEFVERDIRLGIEGWQRVPLPPAVSATTP